MSTLALMAEKRRRIKRERLGPAYEPREAAAAHLRHLLDSGWTRVEIAEQASVARRTVYRILNRPFDVHRDIAKGILALDPKQLPGRILPTGSMRRVQGLSSIGWEQAQIALLTGLHVQFLQDLVAGRYRRIPPEKAAAIERVCRDRFLMPGPSDTARRTAAKHGWVPVTAWEDIDDPACVADVQRDAA